MRKLKAYISSTYKDLKEYRSRALDVLRSLTSMDVVFSPIGMEDYGASAKRPADRCAKDVSEADLVILIIGFNPGSLDVPSSSDENQLTFVLKEVKEAVRMSKRILAFCLLEGSLASVGESKGPIDAKAIEDLREIKKILDQAQILFASVKDVDEFENKLVDSIFQDVIGGDYASFKRHFPGFFDCAGRWLGTVKKRNKDPRMSANLFLERMSLVQGALCCGKTQLLSCLEWEMEVDPQSPLASIIETRIDHGVNGSCILPDSASHCVELIHAADLTKLDFEIEIAESLRNAKGRTLVLLIDDLDSYLFACQTEQNPARRELALENLLVRTQSAISTLHFLLARGVYIIATTTLSINLFHRMLVSHTAVFKEPSPRPGFIKTDSFSSFVDFLATLDHKNAINDQNVVDDPHGLPLAHRILIEGGVRGDALDRSQLIHALGCRLSLIRMATFMLKQYCPSLFTQQIPMVGRGEIGSPWRLLNFAAAVSSLSDAFLRQKEVAQFSEAITIARKSILDLMGMMLMAMGLQVNEVPPRMNSILWLLSFYFVTPVDENHLARQIERALAGCSLALVEDKKSDKDGTKARARLQRASRELIRELQRSGLLHRVEDFPSEYSERNIYVHASPFVRCVSRMGLLDTDVLNANALSISKEDCQVSRAEDRKLGTFQPFPWIKKGEKYWDGKKLEENKGDLVERIECENKMLEYLQKGMYCLEHPDKEDNSRPKWLFWFRKTWEVYEGKMDGWPGMFLWVGDLHLGWRLTSNMHDCVETAIQHIAGMEEDIPLGGMKDSESRVEFCLLAASIMSDRAGFVRLLDDYDFAIFLYRRAEELLDLVDPAKNGRPESASKSVAERIEVVRRASRGGLETTRLVQDPLDVASKRNESIDSKSEGGHDEKLYQWIRSQTGEFTGEGNVLYRMTDRSMLEKLVAVLRLAIFRDVCLDGKCIGDDDDVHGSKEDANDTLPDMENSWLKREMITISGLGKVKTDFLFQNKDIQLLDLLQKYNPWDEKGEPDKGSGFLQKLDRVIGRVDADLPAPSKKYRDLRFVARGTREDRYLGFHPSRLVAFLLKSFPRMLGDVPASEHEEASAYREFRHFKLADCNKAIRLCRIYGYTSVLLSLLRLRAAFFRSNNNHVEALLDYLTFLFGWPAIPAADDSEHGYLIPRYPFSFADVDELTRWVKECRGFIPRLPQTEVHIPALARFEKFYQDSVRHSWECNHSKKIAKYIKSAVGFEPQTVAREEDSEEHTNPEGKNRFARDVARFTAFVDERFRDLSAIYVVYP